MQTLALYCTDMLAVAAAALPLHHGVQQDASPGRTTCTLHLSVLQQVCTALLACTVAGGAASAHHGCLFTDWCGWLAIGFGLNPLAVCEAAQHLDPLHHATLPTKGCMCSAVESTAGIVHVCTMLLTPASSNALMTIVQGVSNSVGSMHRWQPT